MTIFMITKLCFAVLNQEIRASLWTLVKSWLAVSFVTEICQNACLGAFIVAIQLSYMSADKGLLHHPVVHWQLMQISALY